METMEKQAAGMLQRCEVIVLSSVDGNGYPRPVPMSRIKSEGISTVWLSTGSDSRKTHDFAANAKAGLCFYEQGNSVALTGVVEIVRDKAIKKELWQDWFIEHFPQGPEDPAYVLLKFQAQQATYWIDGKFVHRKVGSGQK